jgi:hypothetical protein
MHGLPNAHAMQYHRMSLQSLPLGLVLRRPRTGSPFVLSTVGWHGAGHGGYKILDRQLGGSREQEKGH